MPDESERIKKDGDYTDSFELWKSLNSDMLPNGEGQIDLIEAHYEYAGDLFHNFQAENGGPEESPLRTMTIVGSTFKGYADLDSDEDLALFSERRWVRKGWHECKAEVDAKRRAAGKPVFPVEVSYSGNLDYDLFENDRNRDGTINPDIRELNIRKANLLMFPGFGELKEMRERIRTRLGEQGYTKEEEDAWFEDLVKSAVYGVERAGITGHPDWKDVEAMRDMRERGMIAPDEQEQYWVNRLQVVEAYARELYQPKNS